MGILWNDAIRMDWDWNDEDETADPARVVGPRVAEATHPAGVDDVAESGAMPGAGLPSYFETIAHDVYLPSKTIAHLRRLAGVS